MSQPPRPPSIGTVVTIAAGTQIYRELAINLARSFLRWNTGSGIDLVICTDRLFPLPADLGDVRQITFDAETCGSGFSPKLHLDRLLPPGPTLFIDGDCLVFGPLAPVFERYRGIPFAVPGEAVTEGNFYTDVATLLHRTNLPWLPSFVTSVYYWENTDHESPVFQTARAYEPRYDELGLWRLREKCSDEPLFALGMATHGIKPVPDDGWLKADCHQFDSLPIVNIHRGRAVFRRHSPTIPRPSGPLPGDLRPLIGHFNATYAFQSPYTRETAALRWTLARGCPVFLARCAAHLRYSLPQAIVTGIKDLLRPVFRTLFGARRIRKDPRLA